MDKLKFSQFGVMSVNYQLYSLEYALASIAKAGFRYVDLWGGAPHYSYFDTAPGQRDRRIGEIRRMLDDNGLKVSVFTAEQICLYPINVASSNPYVRRNSLEIVKGYLEDTKALGAIYFFPQMGYCLFDEDEAAAYDRSIESLREINAYAEKLGVKMVMEQLQRYESNLCYDKTTLKRLIDAVGSPNLTACIDCVASACWSVFIAINSTPCRPSLTMRLTALPPPQATKRLNPILKRLERSTTFIWRTAARRGTWFPVKEPTM